MSRLGQMELVSKTLVGIQSFLCPPQLLFFFFFFFFSFGAYAFPHIHVTYFQLFLHSSCCDVCCFFRQDNCRAKESQNPYSPHFLDLPWMSSSHTLPHYPTPFFLFFHGLISSVCIQRILSQRDQRHFVCDVLSQDIQ